MTFHYAYNAGTPSSERWQVRSDRARSTLAEWGTVVLDFVSTPAMANLIARKMNVEG